MPATTNRPQYELGNYGHHIHSSAFKLDVEWGKATVRNASSQDEILPDANGVYPAGSMVKAGDSGCGFNISEVAS